MSRLLDKHGVVHIIASPRPTVMTVCWLSPKGVIRDEKTAATCIECVAHWAAMERWTLDLERP